MCGEDGLFQARVLLGLLVWVSGVFLEWEGRLLPGRVLNMLPDSMCSVPDLGRGPQSQPAAEPGLRRSPTRSLGVQCPGGHRVAYL